MIIRAVVIERTLDITQRYPMFYNVVFFDRNGTEEMRMKFPARMFAQECQVGDEIKFDFTAKERMTTQELVIATTM